MAVLLTEVERCRMLDARHLDAAVLDQLAVHGLVPEPAAPDLDQPPWLMPWDQGPKTDIEVEYENNNFGNDEGA